MPIEIRWAFKVSAWKPCKEKFLKAITSLPLEEIKKIEELGFKEDYESSLIGRLMIRRCIKMISSIQWKDIRLQRSEKGKPVCVNATSGKLFFNISHQGDYTVLAASTQNNIGVDVMKFSPPNQSNIPSFFHRMHRQFVQSEWDYINSFPNELAQLQAFHRLWCLKESYLKAIGSGVGTESAKTMRFQINTPTLSTKCNDSVLFINDKATRWVFEERLLDAKHVVTVASECDGSRSRRRLMRRMKRDFEIVKFERLVKKVQPLVPQDVKWWENYAIKPYKWLMLLIRLLDRK